MKGGAHGAMDPCALDLKLAFLRTASAVDTTCTKTRKLDFFYAKPPGFAPQADAKSADADRPWTREGRRRREQRVAPGGRVSR